MPAGATRRHDYLSESRGTALPRPLGEIIFDFFDSLSPYPRLRSLDYELPASSAPNWSSRHPASGRAGGRVQREVHKYKAYRTGSRWCPGPELIPLQHSRCRSRRRRVALMPGRTSFSANKDVLSSLRGDITPKRKLLERQKEGQAADEGCGRVEGPRPSSPRCPPGEKRG